MKKHILRMAIPMVFACTCALPDDASTAAADADSEVRKPNLTQLERKIPTFEVALTPFAKNFEQPTDMQFVPGADDYAVVLEKTGALKWLNLKTKATGELIKLKVLTVSEQGLLGLAFHPNFATNRKFYMNYVVRGTNKDVTRITEFTWSKENMLKPNAVKLSRVVLTFDQPYQNHNGGQVRFGPDGFLYIGTGDGGSSNDPHGNGHRMSTLLGKMLRIDVNTSVGYEIPQDNPFPKTTGVRPEIWAYGLRNPWRFSFTNDGTLVTGDVGQDAWEEVSIVAKGANLGWKIKEGTHCLQDTHACRMARGLVDPIFEYGREEGVSITGGYTYEGTEIPQLKGKYVFGDFVSGRIWAIPVQKRVTDEEALYLGRWDVSISSFARDPQGNVYVLDFANGEILKIAKKTL